MQLFTSQCACTEARAANGSKGARNSQVDAGVIKLQIHGTTNFHNYMKSVRSLGGEITQYIAHYSKCIAGMVTLQRG